MRLILCVLLLAAIVVSGVNAERNWTSFHPQAFEAPEGRDYVIAIGTHDSLATVNASAIMDALKKGKEIRLKYAKIEGDVEFQGEAIEDVYFISSTFSGEAYFRGAEFSRGADFMDANFSGGTYFTGAKFSEGADFSSAEFSGGADFVSTTFSGRADFRDVEFSGGARANFSGAKFSREAYFDDATFIVRAIFSGTEFSGGAYFIGRTEFSGGAYDLISSVEFSQGADFVSTTFSGRADFMGATFSGVTSFMGATFSGVTSFMRTTFSGRADFKDATFSEEVDFDYATFEGEADFSDTKFLKDPYLTLATFGKSCRLSLENSVYPNIYINLPGDPNKVEVFLNNPSEDTYLRLLKNQRDLGRPNKSLYVAMKRHQRSQKFLLVRWLEWFLFDFPTQYGTASFPPKGMLIYITVVLVVFTASYYGINAHLRRSRDVEILEYNNTDGEEADRPEKLGRWEIVWFSLNTFIPAVHFVNMQHWRITDDRFLRIKCSTLATVESILGWLLIPILLRYFRL